MAHITIAGLPTELAHMAQGFAAEVAEHGHSVSWTSSPTGAGLVDAEGNPVHLVANPPYPAQRPAPEQG